MAAREEKLFSDFWRDLERRVEALLREHCRELIALAQALLDRSSLSGSEVLQILEPKGGAHRLPALILHCVLLRSRTSQRRVPERVFRRIGFYGDHLLAHWVREGESSRMEVNTSTGIRARGAIFQVALDMASHRMKLRPDLMMPSSL